MSDLNYAFYIGCMILYREASYEVSTRRIASELGIGLKDMSDYNCCGLPIEPIDHDMMLTLAARNLCIAEDMGMNIMTMCNGCTGVLVKVNKRLKTERNLRDKVNGFLKEVDMEFKGKIEVKHLAHVLKEDVGLDKLKESVVNPLKSLKVAGYHGCHIFRPSEYLKSENPENPKILDDLIEVTAAERINYLDELQCCGMPCGSVDSSIPLFLSREKLKNVKKEGADMIVTLCPSCHLAMDTNQSMIERSFSESYRIPVLHYPQLLGLAMGIDPKELAINSLRVKPTEILGRVFP